MNHGKPPQPKIGWLILVGVLSRVVRNLVVGSSSFFLCMCVSSDRDVNSQLGYNLTARHRRPLRSCKVYTNFVFPLIGT